MNNYVQLLIRILLLPGLSLLTACQLMPDGNRDLHAPELHFSISPSKDFDLLIASNKKNSSNILHVYIEGDGTPWVNRYFVAKDPGPYGRLALDLMRQDTGPALYLGRPCYYSWRLPTQDNCSSLFWTSARYSETVVQSMSAVLKDYLYTRSFQKIILIGHSGGGTLAYLIAQRVKTISAVVIISGNVDTEAWTRHHHYTPLRRSINPAKLSTHRNLPVIYLTGEQDAVVPPELNKEFLQKIHAKIIVRPDYDHVCCWRNEWKSLIQDLSDSL